MDAILAQAPDGVKITHGTITFSPLSRTLHVGDLSVAGATFQGTARMVDVQGLSLDTLSTGLRAGDTGAEERQTLPVADHIRIHDGKIAFDTAEEAFGFVDVGDIRFRPWALHQPGTPGLDQARAAYTDFIALVERGGGATRPQDVEVAGQILAQAVATGLMAVDIGDLAETDVTVKGMGVASAAGTPVLVHYDRRSLKGIQAGRLGVADLSNLTQTQQGRVVKLARISWDGVDLAAPARALLRGEPLSGSLFDGVSVGALAMSDFSGQLPKGTDFRLDSFTLDPMVVAGGHIGAGGVVLKGFQVDAAAMLPDPRGLAMAKAMGVTKMTLGLALHYKWDFKDSAVTLERSTLTVDELGEVELDGQVHGTEPNQDLKTLFQNAQLDKAQLRYVDRSLVERSLRFAGSQQGKTPDAMRDQAVMAIQVGGLALSASPRGAALVKALVETVRAPGTLVITANPTSPVALAPLFSGTAPDPSALVDALGLGATTTH
ncbi:MAG: hypothetical protein PW843_13200 [Azospirillaceae bacterium]|nr:hypothetical protein [Azospirillaceae bacterium]